MDIALDERPATLLAQLPAGAVVLHAGQHKTGSTAVQNALAAAPQLLARERWLYPQAGRVVDEDTGHRHRELTMDMLRPGPPAAWARLRTELQGRRERVLVSHEGLFAPAIDPRRVAAQLPDREVHVLVYLRHPVDYLESSFREWTRRWQVALGMREWYRQRRAWLEVRPLVARWQAAFGAGRVHLRAYRRDALAGGSVLADVAAQLGLPPLAAPAASNASLNTRQTLVHWVAHRCGAAPAQRAALADLVADPLAAAAALAALPELVAANGFSADEARALERVLDGVAARARLIDDGLAIEVERAHLDGYMDVLSAQGQPFDAWQGEWRGQAFDPGLGDPGLLTAIRVLLGR